MPDREITWRDRLRYRFENTLSKGTIAIIGWLALLSIAIVVLAALILAAMRVGPGPRGPRTSLRLLRGHVAEHAAHAGSGRRGRRQRLAAAPAHDAGHHRRHLHRQHPHRHHHLGPGIAARGDAQGPLARHRNRISR